MDTDTVVGLEKALEWLKTTDPDNLMLGDPTGDPLDIMMGSFRRDILVESVKHKVKAIVSGQ